MAANDAITNIADTCNSLGEVELAGINLESGDGRLLDVTHMDLDRHVAMQPSAMAYYGTLLKDAGRRLDALKRQHNRWKKKKMAEARVAVQNSVKAASSILASDIEARFIVDNEDAIEKWEGQLDKLQREHDTLSVWFEAWKQKSFSMNLHATLTEDERWNASGSLKNTGKSPISKKSSDTDRGLARVRRIIKDRQEREGE